MVQVKDTMRPQVDVPWDLAACMSGAGVERGGQRRVSGERPALRALRTWGPSLGGRGGVVLLTPPGNDEAAHQRGGDFPESLAGG